jgi:hypothetical protein
MFKSVPEAVALELGKLFAQREAAQARAQLATQQAQQIDAAIGALMRTHGIDPAREAVLTERGQPVPLGTVFDAATRKAIELPAPPAPAPVEPPANRATRRARTRR